jgi:hypothetical protein
VDSGTSAMGAPIFGLFHGFLAGGAKLGRTAAGAGGSSGFDSEPTEKRRGRVVPS